MYPFRGQHYISSFLDCDKKALGDMKSLRSASIRGIKESGATLLNDIQHSFSDEACTMVFLLSESHCSLHTYPEYGSVFIDLFTCGDKCHYSKFEQVLKEYLNPKQVISNVIERGNTNSIL